MKPKILALFITCLLTSAGLVAQIDRSKQPEPGPAPTINLGQPDQFSLKNGLKVLIVENHKLPRVSASLIIDNKPHAEGDKAATSSLVSSLLGTGTKNISKDEYNEEIDFLGATIRFGSEQVYANSLSKFFPRVMELMAEGALNPEFTTEEFDSEKNKLIESLKSLNKDVSAIAGRVSSALAYGANHPYGEFPTVENTENVTLDDVRSFYKRYFVPANAYLVIVGDVKTDELETQVRKNFGGWAAANPPSQELPDITNVVETQINFVDMPNAVQSELRLQNTINLEMADEDYFPALVANQILGGSFGSYLNMNLREEHGYTYGARSNTGADKYASRFIAQASVRNAVTDSAIVESLKEIKRIRTEAVEKEILENAKNKFAGDFVLKLEQPSTIANYALNIETNDLPADFYESFLQKINAVSAEDIQRVARKYYQTNNMRIVVTGKGSDILENLENIEFNGKTIPVKYFNKYGQEIEKPANQDLDPSLTVAEIFDNYLEAIGGKDALENIKTLHITAQANIQGQNLDLEMKNTRDKSFISLGMDGNIMSKQVFDGEDGFVVQQGQKMPYDEEQKEAAQNSVDPFTELNPEKAELKRMEQIDGKNAYVVSLDENTEIFYDAETGLRLKSIKTVSQGEETMSIPTGYSNYREVDGVKFPFTISQSMGPQTLDFEVSSVTINEGVSDGDFRE